MRVVFYDVQALMPIGRNEPIETLQQLLAMSDYVSLNVPSSLENQNLIAEPQLQMMKKGAYIINTSYGKAVRR